MSLKAIESKSLETYFKTGNFSTGNFLYGAGLSSTPYANAITYYDRLDVLVMHAYFDQYPSGDREIHCHFDPLGGDNEEPIARWGDVVLGVRANMFCVGEWDKDANTQVLYCGNTTDKKFYNLDLATWVLDNSVNMWPFQWHIGAGGSGGAIGGWDQNNGAVGDFVFFETWGYAIRGCAQVKHTDSNVYRGLALIDLADGKATLLDCPTFFTAYPASLFEAPNFNGDSFSLGRPQFVADDDSLPAAPKGRLFLSQGEYLGDGAVPNSENRVYVKVIEWNPLGVAPAAGTPNRVHLRQILMTKLDFIQRQAFGTNPNSAGTNTDGGSPSAQNVPSFYHPPSRAFVTFFDWKVTTYENERGIVRHSITPELDWIEPPTPQYEVETNKIVQFKARGLGDLGDPVAGITATWSLARRSTVDEQLDTTGAPAANVVAHPPIDPDSLVVAQDGTPLTVGVDYTVVESTGTITWLGAHPVGGSLYTASYGHSTVSATPPHGTLLQEVSETDVDGVAETRVQYPDDEDLAGDKDRLTVSMTD